MAELRSPSDDLADLQAKMAGYLACGARLGWLLDPFEKHVYRRGRDVEILEHPERVDGEDVLNGFVLDSRDIL